MNKLNRSFVDDVALGRVDYSETVDAEIKDLYGRWLWKQVKTPDDEELLQRSFLGIEKKPIRIEEFDIEKKWWFGEQSQKTFD